PLRPVPRAAHPMDRMAAASSFAIDVPAGLLARARGGEAAAFEQLYRRFERPVFTLALRSCGDREEAADVLQDTMLRLFARIGDFRDRKSTRLNSSHVKISYAVFCLKKKIITSI